MWLYSTTLGDSVLEEHNSPDSGSHGQWVSVSLGSTLSGNWSIGFCRRAVPQCEAA